MQRNVKKFLRINNLDIFDMIYCESNILGKHSTFAKMMRKYNLAPEEIIYVGDEIRDVVAAHRMGIKMIGVPWGLHSATLLKKNGIDYMVKKPKEILQIINS